MPFAVAAAAVGVAGTVYASNKASKSAQAGIDAQREMAGDANQLSADRFEWDKWVYENDIAPANKANQELQLMLAEDYLDTSKTNKDFANEQRDEYRKTYLPNERRVAAEAANYDSAENVAGAPAWRPPTSTSSSVTPSGSARARSGATACSPPPAATRWRRTRWPRLAWRWPSRRDEPTKHSRPLRQRSRA